MQQQYTTCIANIYIPNPDRNFHGYKQSSHCWCPIQALQALKVSKQRHLPRKICLKRHSFPWRSLAINSWVGGCRDISYNVQQCASRNIKQNSKSNFNNSSSMAMRVRCLFTKGGRHSSACRLSTENPPCVLVSEAVNVLQNEWTWKCGWRTGEDSFSPEFSFP